MNGRSFRATAHKGVASLGNSSREDVQVTDRIRVHDPSVAVDY